MNREWSQWVPVVQWFQSGWNEPTIPWAKGVYRFRIAQSHPARGGEIVYIGRGGRHADKETSMICSRVGLFITAAMGFWTGHYGGNRFFVEAADDDYPKGHLLNVRDLEVSWALDDDPECREAEEVVANGRELPVFNRQQPRTCRREAVCDRAMRLRREHGYW